MAAAHATKSSRAMTSLKVVMVMMVLVAQYHVYGKRSIEKPNEPELPERTISKVDSQVLPADTKAKGPEEFIPASAWKYLAASLGGALLATCLATRQAAKKSQKEMSAKARKELQDLIPKRSSKEQRAIASFAAEVSSLGSLSQENDCPSPSCNTLNKSSPLPAGPAEPESKIQAWAPGKALSADEKVERQIKSILNKLTRDNYDKLYAQLLESGISKQSHVECLARNVFMKATCQHQFVKMYADLCRDLNESLLAEWSVSGDCDFKKVLLDQCQEAFALYMQTPTIDENLSYDEQYEEWVKYKTKMIGNIRLIGHLLARKMLSPKIIFLCSEELLKCGSEEALETLSAFLETIGPTFDTPKWVGSSKLQEVFSLVKILAEDEGQSARIRCLLKDVLDKKANRWQEACLQEAEQDQQKSKVVHKKVNEEFPKSADTDADWRRSGGKTVLKADTPKGGDRNKMSVPKKGNWRTLISAAAQI